MAMTFVAEICDVTGVFDEAAHWAARAARGRVTLLWLLVIVLAVASTIVLSLDTTAVLLTPVAITVARQVGADAEPFAMTTLWLANTASLLLPVSNLSNLLARQPLAALGIGTRGYIALIAPSAVAAVVATLAVLWLVHRRELAGRYTTTPRAEPHDRGLMLATAGVVVLLAGAFVAEVEPWLAASVAALALLAATRWRSRHLLRSITMPWWTVAGIAALFVVVDVILRLGGEGLLRNTMGSGTGVLNLLRIAGVGAVASNAINNLPTYLALERTVTDNSARLAALLVGVNAGPIVTTWGSVATLLWRQRCRSLGVDVSARRLALTGALCAAAAVTTGTLLLAGTR